MLFFLLGYLPIVGGSAMLVHRLTGPDVPGMCLAGLWMLAILVSWYRLLSFACPRCGEWFHTKWFGWFFLGKRCVHCSLQRGS